MCLFFPLDQSCFPGRHGVKWYTIICFTSSGLNLIRNYRFSTLVNVSLAVNNVNQLMFHASWELKSNMTSQHFYNFPNKWTQTTRDRNSNGNRKCLQLWARDSKHKIIQCLPQPRLPRPPLRAPLSALFVHPPWRSMACVLCCFRQRFSL